jgi:hypothetical protein
MALGDKLGHVRIIFLHNDTLKISINQISHAYSNF